MRDEIDNFNNNKQRYKRSLTISNNKKLKKIREETRNKKRR